MAGIDKLLQEIHRRSLWQVIGLYAAGSWVTLEVVATFLADGREGSLNRYIVLRVRGGS